MEVFGIKGVWKWRTEGCGLESQGAGKRTKAIVC